VVSVKHIIVQDKLQWSSSIPRLRGKRRYLEWEDHERGRKCYKGCEIGRLPGVVPMWVQASKQATLITLSLTTAMGVNLTAILLPGLQQSMPTSWMKLQAVSSSLLQEPISNGSFKTFLCNSWPCFRVMPDRLQGAFEAANH
jgi:hypothetical protein